MNALGNHDKIIIMTSSDGNIFSVTVHLWGESTGHQWISLAKASDTELWCFLWSMPERLSKLSRHRWFETLSRSLWRYCNLSPISSQRAPHSLSVRASYRVSFVSIDLYCSVSVVWNEMLCYIKPRYNITRLYTTKTTKACANVAGHTLYRGQAIIWTNYGLAYCHPRNIHMFFMYTMMTSSNGSISRVPGPLRGESTGDRWIPLTQASDAELWCFLWSAPEQTAEEAIETPLIHYNDVTMGAISSQITSLKIFYSTVDSDADQR